MDYLFIAESLQNLARGFFGPEMFVTVSSFLNIARYDHWRFYIYNVKMFYGLQLFSNPSDVRDSTHGLMNVHLSERERGLPLMLSY